MSDSNPNPARGAADLVVFGDPGVEIQIVDANYQVVASGTDKVQKTLPEGVYMVDWTSKGQTEQKLVRLLPVDKPLEVRPDASLGGGSSIVPAPSPDGTNSAFTELLQDQLRPSERDYGSEVLVATRASDSRTALGSDIGLRLINAAGVAMRSDEEGLTSEQPQITDGYVTRLYHVPAGNFTLRYTAITGETLEQTIPALKARRSIVFMTAGIGRVLRAKAGAFKPVEHHGIDPARTIVVSVPRSGARPDLVETTRLAEILLHDLAAGSGSLGSALNNALDAADTDPFLKLYGALVVLNQLKRGASPALDEAWPAEPTAQIDFRARWRKRAAEWLHTASENGAPPDLIAASWRLQAEGEEGIGQFKRLSSPPMLECAWRWVAAQSARDPKALPMTASLRAAARTAGGTAPWLSWQPTAAKAPIAPVPTGQNDDIDTLIEKVADRVRPILDNPEATAAAGLSNPLSFLSQNARAMALSVFQLTGSRSQERGVRGEIDPAKELAAQFGAPAPQLKRRLVGALGELDASEPVTGTRPGGRSSQSADSDPPALSRMIMVPDDPNKGRFGGRRSRGGFELRAAFTPTSDKNWVGITLTVAAKKEVPKGAVAEFFLHDSFRPSRVKATFRNAVATHTVTASGGFTVGAWIPSEEVELELDLAHEPRTPNIIRER
jgi:hypothetical protein